MNAADIINILNYGLIGLFALVCFVLVFSFIRGLFRGWRYGTYRLGYFAIHIIIGLALLPSLAGWIGEVDLASLSNATSGSFDLNGTTISFQIGTIKETGLDIVTQVMRNYSPSSDPQAVYNLAFSLVGSMLQLVAILIEGLLLATIFHFFCFLLWHLFFKRIIPIQNRKASYRKGKLVSAFEDLVIAVVVGAMILVPCSSLINSVIHGFDTAVTSNEQKEKIKLNGEPYQIAVEAANTYDNSLFSKVLFSWTMNEEGKTFDQVLMDWLTSSDYNNTKISFVSELQNVTEIASYAVESGILSENVSDAHRIYLFLTSEFAPKLITSLAKSNLITGVLPFAFQILTNIDQVKDFIGNEWNVDYSSFDWPKVITNLSDFLADLQSSVLNESSLSYDEASGQFSLNNDVDLFSDANQNAFNSAFSRISSNNENFQVFNDLLIAFAMNSALNDATSSDSQLGLSDFLPPVPEGYYRVDEVTGRKVLIKNEAEGKTIPDAYRELDLANEVGVLYRSFARLGGDFVGTLIDGLLNNSFNLTDFLEALLNNLDCAVGAIVGEKENGSFPATSEKNNCLLDSALVTNAMPKVFTMLGEMTNTSLKLADEAKVDVSDVNNVLFYDENGNLLPLNTRKQNEKEEINNILKIVTEFADSSAGKELLLHYDTLPGITFDANGDLNHIDDALFAAIQKPLASIDDSLLLSTVLPKAIDGLMKNNDGLISIFGTDVEFDFSPVDESGKSVLGGEMSKLISLFADAQDLIYYVQSNADLTSNSDDKTAMNAFLKGLAPFVQGGEDSSLFRLLNGFAESRILNPDIQGETGTIKNSNYRNVLKSVLSLVGITDLDSLSEKFTPRKENKALCEIVYQIIDQEAISLLSGEISLSSLTRLNFEAILAPLNDTDLLRTVFAKLLDDNLLKVLTSSEVSVEGISFNNVTDWGIEGESLNVLMRFASMVGDFSNLDLFNSDPNAISGLLGTLSANQMFVAKDGTNKFGDFAYNLIVSSLDDSSKELFTDKDDESSTAQFESDMASVTSWTEESERIGNAIGAIFDSGLMDAVKGGGTIELEHLNISALSSLLNTLAESESVGRVLAYHFYEKLGEALDSTGFKGGTDLNIDEIWNSYSGSATYLTDVSKRKAEFNLLTDLVSYVIDENYGLYDETKGTVVLDFSAIDELSSDFLVKPLLKAMAHSVVFNTTTSEDRMTSFEQEFSYIVYSTGVYGKDEEGESAIQDKVNGYVKDIRGGAANDYRNCYETEINSWGSMVDSLNALGLGTNFSFDGFFTKDGSLREDAEIRKANLDDLLSAMNDSKVLYHLLPTKLSEASETIGTLKAPNAKVLDSQESYVKDELHKLTRCLLLIEETGLSDSGALTSVTALSSKSDPVTELLSIMANSRLFNSSENSGDLTTFQDILVKLLGSDDLGSLYYSSLSSKDASFGDAQAKAEANVTSLFPNYTNESIVERTELLDGDEFSLKTLLDFLGENEGILDSLLDSSFTSVSETNLVALFEEIHFNDLLTDVVPNGIAKFTSSAGFGSTFDLSSADPYYAQRQNKKYDKGEIGNLAHLLVTLNSSKDLFSDMNANTEGLSFTIEDVFRSLNSSHIFHNNGKTNPDADTSALTVFEQAIYNFYTQSKLSPIAYSNVYDSAKFGHIDETLSNYDDLLSEKAAMKIKTLILNETRGENTLNRFSDFDWGDEITAIKAMLDKAISLDLFGDDGKVTFNSGTLGFASATDAAFLDKAKEVCLTLNDCKLINDAPSYQVEALLSDTPKLSAFSHVTKVYFVSGGSFKLTKDDSFGNIANVAINDGATNVEVSYSYEGRLYDGENNQSFSSIDWKNLHPYSLSLKGDGLTEVTIEFETADYLNTKNEGIDSIVEFAKTILASNEGSGESGYPTFSESGNSASADTLLKAGVVSSLLKFLDAENGFYLNSIPGTDYFSRDLTFRRLLKMDMEISGKTATIDLGKYMSNKTSEDSFCSSIKNAFEGMKFNSESKKDYAYEEARLTNNIALFGAVDTVISASAPLYEKMSTLASSVAYEDSSPLYSTLADIFDNAKDKDSSTRKASSFGERILAGELANFLKLQIAYPSDENKLPDVSSITEYAKPTDMTNFDSDCLSLINKIGDVGSLTNRLVINRDTSSVLKSIFAFAKVTPPVISDIATYNSMRTSSLSGVKAIYQARDVIISTDEDLKLLAAIFALGTEYDSLVYYGYYHAANETYSAASYPSMFDASNDFVTSYYTNAALILS